MANLDDLDDFDLDDLDMDLDFDDNPMDNAEDRSPVERAAAGALDSLTDTSTATSVATALGKNALPEGFKSTFAAGDKVIDQTNRLYDQAKEELSGPLGRLKKTINSNVDKLPGFVSDEMKDKIRSFTDDDDSSLSDSKKFDPDQAAIDSSLSSIFTLEAERAASEAEVQAGQKETEMGLRKAESAIQSKFQSEQAISNKITYQWQHKALELQHRQFFLARDTLAVIRADAEDAKTSRASLVKNTALPDFLKIRNTENFNRIAEEGILGTVNETMGEYLQNFGTNLASNVSTRLTEFSGTVAQGVDGLDQILGLAGDDSIDGIELAGGIAAEAAASGAAGNLGRRLRKYLEDNPEIMERSAQLQYGVENAGFLAEERLNQYDGFGSEFLRDILPTFSGNGVRINNALSENASENALFDNQTHRSINEVIPGFLSRILQQVTMSNTGEQEGLVTYSVDSESFVSQEQAAENLRQRVFKRAAETNNRNLEEIMKILDPENALSDEDREAMMDLLTEDAANGSYRFDINDYVDDERSERDNLRASRIFRDINATSNVQGSINDTIRRGDRDLLRSLGVVQDAGAEEDFSRVNRETVAQLLRGNNTFRETDAVARPVTRVPGAYNTVAAGQPAISDVDLSAALQLLEGLQGAVVEVGPSTATALLEEADGISAVPVRLVGKNGNPLEEDGAGTPPMLTIVTDGFKITHELLAAIEAKTGYVFGEMEGGDGTAFSRMRNRAGGFVSDVFEGASSLTKGYFAGMTMLTSQLTSTAAGALSGAGRLASSAVSGITNSDIYIKGSNLPALLASKMKEGKYFDLETGEVIKNLKDIKGTVVDELGNIVLTAEDVQMGIFTPRGINISGLFNAISNPLTAALNFQTNAFNFAMRVPGKAKDLFQRASEYVGDVYVAGETTPRILKSVLLNGGYVSAVTGKVITKLSEIDGDLLDRNGNVVLSLDDFRRGIFRRNGIRIDTTAFSKIKGLLMSGVNVAKKVINTGIEFGVNTVRSAGEILGAGAGGLANQLRGGNDGGYSKRIYEHMQKRWPLLGDGESSRLGSNIASALDEQTDRLHAAIVPERVPGDSDGDGDRDGSAEDILQRRREAEAQAAAEEGVAPEEEPEKKEGLLSKLAGPLMALVPAITTGFGAVTSILGGLATAVTGYFAARRVAGAADLAGDMMDGPDRRPGGNRGGGKLGKLKNLAGRGLSAVGGAAKGGGRLVAGVAKSGAAKVAGGFIARRAAIAGVGAAAAGAGAVVGGIALAPVIAAAGAAYTVYEVASFFVGRMDAEPLESIRFMQYGLDTSSGSQLSAIRDFEDEILDDYIQISGSNVRFTGDLKTIRDEFADDIFDVDMDSADQVTAFDTWFAMRFLPVFMQHLSAITAIDSSVDLLDVDDEIEDEHVISFLNRIMLKRDKFESNAFPLSVSASPFPGFTSLSNQNNVRKVADQLLEEYSSDASPKDLVAFKAAKKKSKDANGEEEVALGLNKRSVDDFVNGSLGYKDRSQKVQTPRGFKPQAAPAQVGVEGERNAGAANMIMPVEGGRVSSPFGNRTHPVLGGRSSHKGIDIAAKSGTPIYSPVDGEIYRQYRSKSYGNVIYLKHKDGTASRYAHMHSFAEGAGVGVQIKQGQLLGYVGNTGRSTGPHLHWEVRTNTDQDAPVMNPLKLINSQLKRKVEEEIKKEETATTTENEDSGNESGDITEGQSTIGVTEKSVADNQKVGNIVVGDKEGVSEDKEVENASKSLAASNARIRTATAAPTEQAAKETAKQLEVLNSNTMAQEKMIDQASGQRERMITELTSIRELLKALKMQEGKTAQATAPTNIPKAPTEPKIPVPMSD